MELPKLPARLPNVILSVEEIERVIHTKTNTLYGVRDRAILELLYSTGIRKMECALLGTYDVDSRRQPVFVRSGKGTKDRLLPIGERALHWVNRYQQEVRPELLTDSNTSELFLTDYGEPFIKNRLSSLVRRYLHHAEIDKPGACHLFRHAMATHMLDNGADIRFIQSMLGHSELSTTEIYTQASAKWQPRSNASSISLEIMDMALYVCTNVNTGEIMQFEDAAKNEISIRRHGIDFEDVRDIFNHPMAPDDTRDDYEKPAGRIGWIQTILVWFFIPTCWRCYPLSLPERQQKAGASI